jgi:selT/selW/selH-like putative selenoprotein
LTEQLLNEYKLRLHGLTLAPYDDGRFEVFVNGKKIYSKHATGKFPEYKQVYTALEKALV